MFLRRIVALEENLVGVALDKRIVADAFVGELLFGLQKRKELTKSKFALLVLLVTFRYFQVLGFGVSQLFEGKLFLLVWCFEVGEWFNLKIVFFNCFFLTF